MIRRKPFPLLLIKAAIKKVTTAQEHFSNFHSATRPALVTAEPASPRPITMIIGPMMIGGKSLQSNLYLQNEHQQPQGHRLNQSR